FSSSSAWRVFSYVLDGMTPDWIEFSQTSGEAGENTITLNITKTNNEEGMDARSAFIKIEGSGNAEIQIHVLQSLGPEGSKLIDNINIYNEFESKIGGFDFTYNFQGVPSHHADYNNNIVLFTFAYGNIEKSGLYSLPVMNHSLLIDGIIECIANFSVKQEQNVLLSYEGHTACYHAGISENILKEFKYNSVGQLSKIIQTIPLEDVTDISWNGSNITSIQTTDDIVYFSYNRAQRNDLNLDLFYFILYGTFCWDEPANLLQITGTRSTHLPEMIRHKNAQYEIEYIRDTDRYISIIKFDDKIGNDTFEWHINYIDGV
ncbi:hypothetical protein LJB85_04355, partial [Porphyromonadaceae bacterium OttesenSCG-928-L07]|nr:hypothetical protein [Porphyromonadaceae bacterium OttesenSCG-928-L07]